MEQEQRKENEQQAGLDAWDEFIAGDFLKAELVIGESEGFKIEQSEAVFENNEKRFRIHVKKKGMDKLLKFDFNKTNAKFVKELKITPTELAGKTIYFKKVMARDPTKNIEVESLRISKIE